MSRNCHIFCGSSITGRSSADQCCLTDGQPAGRWPFAIDQPNRCVGRPASTTPELAPNRCNGPLGFSQNGYDRHEHFCSRAIPGRDLLGRTGARSSPEREARATPRGPARFPFPIYSTWFKQFSKETPGVIVDYQAKGSGAGIQDFINHTVDFAGSDAAMTDAEMAKVEGGVVLIPITAGEIVIAYNLPGNPAGLKLPRDVYPQIFLGKITRWNDPKIAAANPNLKLPDLPITVVRRSDASGTTFVFTKHLSAISPEFAKQVGFGTTVEWPKSDKIVGAPKNDGVTATIRQA